MNIEDFCYDDLIDEDKEVYDQRKKEYEEEQYNSPISMYSLGLCDRDFF